MNQPQCAATALLRVSHRRDRGKGGNAAQLDRGLAVSSVPPSVQPSRRRELTLGTAQAQFIMGVAQKKTHRAEVSTATNSEALFLRGRDAVASYVTTRAASPEAFASSHTQTLEQQQQHVAAGQRGSSPRRAPSAVPGVRGERVVLNS